MIAPTSHDLGNDIARALRGRRLTPFTWSAPCPLKDRHRRRKGSGAPSLRVTIVGRGLDVECLSGCQQAELRTWLARRGFLDDDGPVVHEPDPEALAIWSEAEPIADTLGHRYFREAGITGPLPPSLRYRRPGAVRLPQIVAGIQAPDGRVVAVQLIFLARLKPQLAEVPRLVVGTLGRSAFRTAPSSPQLRIVETVEEAVRLSKAGTTAWAALAGWRVDRIELPRIAERVAA